MKEITLIKYYQKQLDDTTSSEVEFWLEADQANRNLYNETIRIWVAAEKASVFDHINDPGKIHLNSNMSVNLNWKRWLPYAAILVIALASAFYFLQVKEYQPTYAVLENISDKTKEVTLFDGSKVYLRANTSLYYPKDFTKKKRQVKLEGEAFFEIIKDEERPFIIEAGKTNVKVLGTSFLVKTAIDKTEVSVTTGKVQFSHQSKPELTIILTKGEEALIDQGKVVKTISDINKISWKTGVFEFKGIALEAALDLLNDFYKKPILLRKGEQSQGLITACFDNESQENVLETLKFIYNLSVIDQGNYFELSINQE